MTTEMTVSLKMLATTFINPRIEKMRCRPVIGFSLFRSGVRGWLEKTIPTCSMFTRSDTATRTEKIGRRSLMMKSISGPK